MMRGGIGGIAYTSLLRCAMNDMFPPAPSGLQLHTTKER